MREIGHREDGTLIGEKDGRLYAGTPKQITHADLTATTSTDAEGRFVQEWGYAGEVFLRQTLDHDSWVKGRVDEMLKSVERTSELVEAATSEAEALWESETTRTSMPASYTKAAARGPDDEDGEPTFVLVDVPVTLTAYTWEAI